jgi:hypothetical protein
MTKPTDGCSKTTTIFFNKGNGKIYDEKFVDLQRINDLYAEEQEKKEKETTEKINKEISSINSETGVKKFIGDDTFETFKVRELLSQSING